MIFIFSAALPTSPEILRWRLVLVADACGLDDEVPEDENEEGPKVMLKDHCLKASRIALHSTKVGEIIK